MPNYNSVTIIGHLTRSPELMTGRSGTQFAKGGIAYNDFKKVAHFFDFTAFGKTAEMLCGSFEKGDAVGLVGELVQDSWTDKESGQKRSKVCINVNRLIFLGSKAGEKPASTPRDSEPDEGGYDDYATSLPQ